MPQKDYNLLTKEAYFRECFLRNEEFHADFRRFCERYPLVWHVQGSKGRTRLQKLLARLGPHVEIGAPRPDCTIVRLPNFAAHRAHAALVPNPYKLEGELEAIPAAGWYFELIGATDEEPATSFSEAVRIWSVRWPMYRGWQHAGALLLSEVRGRPDLIRSENILKFGFAFRDFLTRHAAVWVPIYPDTHPEDISWQRILHAKKLAYGGDRRVSRRKLAFRLRVYDLVGEGKTLTDATTKFRVKRERARDAYLAVARDIASVSAFPLAEDEGRQDPTLRNFDLHGHVRTCEVCRRPVGDRYCPATSRYLKTLETVPAA